MTLSELQKWRMVIPWSIVTLGLVPWALVTFGGASEAKPYTDLILPAAAAVGVFVYLGLGIRDRFWSKENDLHVGRQIRLALLPMIPQDLNVTEGEKKVLEEWEIFKKLTGVFWEAVDRDERLRAHKQHFYANGMKYTTSYDAFLLCGFLAVCYLLAFLLKGESTFLYIAVGLVLISGFSRLIVTPRVRKRHLELSEEQLDLLGRNQADYVSGRFRELILDWRTKGDLG